MSAGLFDRLKTLALATTNSAVSKAEKAESIPVLEQKARDLETQTETLNGEVATAIGHNRTLHRDKDQLQAQIDQAMKDGTNIKNGTAPNKDQLLALKAASIVKMRQDMAAKDAEIAAGEAAATQLDSVFAQVKQESQDINNRIRTLRSQKVTGEAQSHAADVIQKTSDLLGTVNSSSIDDIASGIQADNDVSAVKLERAISTFSGSQPVADPAAVSDVMASF